MPQIRGYQLMSDLLTSEDLATRHQKPTKWRNKWLALDYMLCADCKREWAKGEVFFDCCDGPWNSIEEAQEQAAASHAYQISHDGEEITEYLGSFPVEQQ